MRKIWTTGRLAFERQEDGSVRVMKYPDAPNPWGAPPVFEVVLHPDAWTAVFASMSALGNDADRWDKAKQFHGETR